MAIVQICDFGEKDGIRTYSIQGDKSDLEIIIKECRKMDAKFDDIPVIENVRKELWSMVLRLKVVVEVGGDG